MKLNKNGSLPKAVRFQMYKEALEILKEGTVIDGDVFPYPNVEFSDINTRRRIFGLCQVFQGLLCHKLGNTQQDIIDTELDVFNEMLVLFPELDKYRPSVGVYWFEEGDLKPRIKIIEEILGGKNE